MKAIGRNLIIKKAQQETTKTKGGLLLGKKDQQDIRYTQAEILSVGDEIKGLNEKDIIYFDRHAGHKIEVENNTYHVIKSQDVVVVL
ncbi:co-chaperone GroES family protein [Phenylobacterium sp.]|jgi:co-chaperonin GroES (HSP10)|uniref:co-chaperone GroES family protein n=1 Tax=Phenylobacterium sp. TaxID=1871053 RepID=UPI000C907A15|nr:co-chaperone GroES family protein [Phenylobacterium sp.]MAK80295.1 hypothetical protein [Phenylobacterium sp.]|tara:strand:- start:756 stop:1016 length:261 start_codon:yes stop_codon:yes gene_type:complete